MMLLANEVTPEYKAGYWLGRMFIVILVLWGLGKGVMLLRRPATSKLCVSAILLLLLALLVNVIWTQVMHSGVVPEHLSWGLLLFNMPLYLAATVVAIIGLAIYDRQRFNQGRAQAIWALVLSLLGMAVSIGTQVGGQVTELAKQLASGRAIGQPGAPVDLPEWNFSITPPDATWQRRSAKDWNELACVAFYKADEMIYAIVIAEKDISYVDAGLDQTAQVVKDGLAGNAKVISQREEKTQMDGMECRRIISRLKPNNVPYEADFEHRVVVHNGHIWQLVVWSGAGKTAHVARAAEELAQGFRLLDRDQKPPMTEGLDLDLPGAGLASQDLATDGWMRWTREQDPANAPPVLTTLSLQSSNSAFVVRYCQPVPDMPPLPLESVARACLAELKFSYQRHLQNFATRELTEPFPGLEIATEREIEDDGTYTYLFRFYQSGGHAWMIGGWTRKGQGHSLDKVRQSMQRVTLSVPKAGSKAPDLSVEQTTALSVWCNQAGLWFYVEERYEEALKCFRTAYRQSPQDYDFFQNVADCLEKLDKPAEALAWLEDSAGRSFEKDPRLHLMQASLLVSNDKIWAVTTKAKEVIQGGHRDDSNVLEVLNKLVQKEKYAEAQDLARVYAQATGAPKQRLWQAQIASAADEPKEMEKLLTALLKDEPDYAEAAYSLGELHNSEGRYDDALAVATKLESDGQNTARLHVMRGWSHMGRRWYREAKASFEKAAALAPGDEDVKAALKEAAAHLGQGSNSEIKTPIAAVPLPASVAARLPALRKLPADFGQGHQLATLLWARCYHYTPGTPMRTTLHRQVYVVDDQGAESATTLQFNYDPLVEKLFVNKVRVLDGEGQVLATATEDDMYVLDAEDRSMATTERTLNIQVPGVRPGCVVESVITIERLARSPSFPLMRHSFYNGSPARLEVISVTGDVKGIAVQLENQGRVKEVRSDTELVYEITDAPVHEDETYQQPVTRHLPVLVLAGEQKSWAELVTAYLKDIAPRLKPDADVAAEAKKITAGCTSVPEKVRALSAHIQKNIRYKAIEFGVRGRMPNDAAQTLKQRFGDCKDQALLLHHLLQASGIESYLALINTNWELELKLPDLDAFNHAILYVPALKASPFVDTTNSYAACADYPPYGLWGTEALVLDAKNPRIVKVPQAPESSGNVASTRSLSLDKEGTLHVKEKVTMLGYYASGLRSSFSSVSPKDRFKYAQDFLVDREKFRLQDYEFENLDDTHRPAILHLHYTLADAAEARGGVTRLRLPAVWELKYLDIRFIKDRQTNFHWQIPFHLSSTVTWDATLDIDPDSLERWKKDSRGSHGTWTAKPGERSVNFEFQAKAGDYPAAEYDSFYQFWRSALDLWGRELTLKAP